MYVYDGDSIYAPLIGVFSGLVVPEAKEKESVPEVVTTSGYALLHFFSDAAYNLTGFNIAYSINSCPNNCSGHGRCGAGNSEAGRVYCECDEYWKGEACAVPYCRDDCGSPDHGYCDLTGEKLCVCNDSWQASFVEKMFLALLHSYNLDTSVWDVVPASSGPLYRYGHSLALYQDCIYMFGGKLETGPANITDELWLFNIPTRSWLPQKPASAPLYALEGHTAHVVILPNGDPVMLVFFGYSPIYSYINKVQEYNIRSNLWQVVSVGGAVVQGGYAHSSVYDQAGGCVYIHGGYTALSNNKYGLVDHMYRYVVSTRTWYYIGCLLETNYQYLFLQIPTSNEIEEIILQLVEVNTRQIPMSALKGKLILRESRLPRYLHSAVLLSGTMLVFGGNTHNDTSLSNGAKCFSTDFLAYDIGDVDLYLVPQ
uniref:Attractin-like protein 1 n=1 Tax=Poecilia formosa TaxID=48698 RepID=A0A096MCK5_POEFO